MKIAILGSGGVGGYFGAKLAQAGNDVTFLARGAHLKKMQTHGLSIKSILGDFHVNNITATDTIADIKNPDLIIVAVKAWQVKEIRDDINKITSSNTIILPLQNGVLAAQELAESIDNSHIIGGLCRLISKVETPGVINHFGVNPTIVFGELDGVISERTKNIKNVFDEAGIACKLSNNIEAEVWKKFISICISGLLGVTRATYGVIRETIETRLMMIDLLYEVYTLSQKMGITIEADFVSKTVAFIDSFTHDSTSSLARDVWEGKPSEIEYQNGTVVQLGEKYNVKTPINAFIYNCIIPMENKARKV